MKEHMTHFQNRTIWLKKTKPQHDLHIFNSFNPIYIYIYILIHSILNLFRLLNMLKIYLLYIYNFKKLIISKNILICF